MDNSTIGIKIADGTYFPVLKGESSQRKKLILTTVNDDQSSVQIDLYRGKGQTLTDALYIGSLVIEDIMPEMKGEPEIELIIGVDEEGTLNAVAGDSGSGEKQSLSVSLESLEDVEYKSPDFELNDAVFDDVPSFDEEPDGDELFDDPEPFDDFGSDEDFEEPELSPVYESDTETFPDENKKKRSPLALIILILLIIAILGLGAFLILRGLNGDTVPALEAENVPAAVQPEAEAPVVVAKPEAEAVVVEEPVVEEPAEIAEPEPEPEAAAAEVLPVEDVPAIEAIMKTDNISISDGIPPEGQGGGVWYRLKWGDTLWDLSNSFYRTPWLYKLIAVENDIKNPDIIYAGADILIPEN